MTRWFIKKTCTATDDNPSFPGAVEEYIYGKRQNIICNKVVKDVNGYSNWSIHRDRSNDKEFLDEFGYGTEKMAEVVLTRLLKHPVIKDRFWDDTYEIIKINF